MSEINHASRLEWDMRGNCKYRVLKKKKCTGEPGYSGGCAGRYTDEYGSTHSCAPCRGTGTVQYWVYMRVPQFDAPRPPAGWVPDWVEG